MIPDLGKYAATVLSAYAAGLLLILALIAFTLWRAARVRRALEAQERKQD